MTETSAAPVPREDLTLSIIVYTLFIISLLGVFPAALVGVFMAYVSKGTSGPVATGHFRFQIRTFWIGLAAAASGALWGWSGRYRAHPARAPIALQSDLGVVRVRSFGIPDRRIDEVEGPGRRSSECP